MGLGFEFWVRGLGFDAARAPADPRRPHLWGVGLGGWGFVSGILCLGVWGLGVGVGGLETRAQATPPAHSLLPVRTVAGRARLGREQKSFM